MNHPHMRRSVALSIGILGAAILSIEAPSWRGLAASSPHVLAQGNPYTSLFPPNVGEIDLCDQFDVSVEVWAAGPTTAFQFHIGFEDTVLEMHSAHLGPFLSSTGRDVTVLPTIVENGDLFFAAAAEPGDEPLPSGSGELAVIRFRAIGSGTSELDLRDALLVGDSGSTPVTSTDSAVIVSTEMSDACFPTPTSTFEPPTASATTPAATTPPPPSATTVAPPATTTAPPSTTASVSPSPTGATATSSVTPPSPTPRTHTATPSVTPTDSPTSTLTPEGTEPTPTDGPTQPSSTATSLAAFRIFAPFTAVSRGAEALTASYVHAAPDLYWEPGDGQPGAQEEPDQTAVVRLIPASIPAAEVGEEVSLVLWVDDPVSLAAFQVTLDLNPNVVEFVSFDVGPLLGSTGRQVVEQPDFVEESRVTVGAVSFDGPGPSVSGELGTFTFRIVGVGTSQLSFSDVNLTDEGNEKQPAESRSAIIMVGGQIFLPYAAQGGAS